MAKLIQFLCSEEFHNTKEAVATPGTTRQDHRVSQSFDQKVCL